MDKTTGNVLCSGIIVTTNLLATSHECLQLPRRQYNVFDSWSPKSGSRNMLNVSRFSVSKTSTTTSSQFRVVRVIYNHRYGVNLASSSHPKYNLVLLQVTPEFTTDSDLSPICIPERASDLTNLWGQEAYFYGLSGKAKSRGGNQYYGCEAPTPPTTRPPILPPPPKELDQLPVSISGLIIEESNCSSEIHSKTGQLLCFHVTSHEKPRFGDGALVYTSKNETNSHFLIGISAVRPPSGKDDHELINFSKISGEFGNSCNLQTD